MAQTQKMYLGGVPVIQNYFGENPIVSLISPQYPLAPYQIEYLVYAGGGGGGSRSTYDGGGGGAGGLLSGSFTINPSTIYQIKAGTAGQDSYFTGSLIYQYAFAGGSGGSSVNGAATSGGSGGGGGGNAGLGAAGISGQGFAGATANNSAGGGGGGAGSAAGTPERRSPGSGKISSISGTSLTYCEGGAGGANNGAARFRGAGGYGGSSDVTGGGAGGGGEVIIRYLGPQKGFGGTVTTDGPYVIHTFTSGSTSTYTG